MKIMKDFTQEIAIILAETANKVLLDSTSWSIFAYNDEFKVVKDFNERYNTRVRSRLGGILFKGLSYMPDAIEIAGKTLAKRGEELKIVAVISDGWPYGYPNIYTVTKKIISKLGEANIVVIGIGAKSGRMELLFETNCASYTQKELVNQFGVRYRDVCSFV
jgi:hypothetical protein